MMGNCYVILGRNYTKSDVYKIRCDANFKQIRTALNLIRIILWYKVEKSFFLSFEAKNCVAYFPA